METGGFFKLKSSKICKLFLIHLNTFDHYKYVYSYSAGIDFTRQNLTSTDVRF